MGGVGGEGWRWCGGDVVGSGWVGDVVGSGWGGCVLGVGGWVWEWVVIKYRCMKK